jgi:signal transduction histidine kinase
MRHLLNAAILLGVALLSAWLMGAAYWRARSDAIAQLYAQEHILANQAAKGITEYFTYYEQTLTFLARDVDVVRANERGRHLLREFCISQADSLVSVTRVGADGRILYTYPEERAIGRDISTQAHVRTAFATHKPVVSEVFTSVQGFQTVALHVPVFEDQAFTGTLAVLIPFSAISRKHVEGARIRDAGNALLLSRDGVELYCPITAHVGRSVRDTSSSFPGFLTMADRMLRGETGTAVYDYTRDGLPGQPTFRKQAYFEPIPLDNTFWTIAVTAPEDESLAFIQGFRNRWITGVSLLLASFGVWGFFLARAFLTIHRQEARRVAAERIQAAERRADEQKARLEAQLWQAQKLEAVGQLAGGVAHDFNNLLTVQFGHLNLLQEAHDLPADVRESLSEIEKSATMAARLTRQLLAFSRRQILQITRLDLNAVLDHILSMLRRVLREDISLELKMAADPLWVDADAGMMEQVVMNLVVNARDAMPAGGRLTLATEALDVSAEALPAHAECGPGRYVRLSVTDTGQGMDADTRERLFEPFFTTKAPGQGTGLGLATVYGIVTQHKGWIDVESTQGEGTTFRVYYPEATDPGDSQAETEKALQLAPRGHGETILLAEDNPAVRRAVTASLERLNYKVVAAANSIEAVQAWDDRHGAIDLLLTDMVMPEGGNGLQLVNALREKRPGLKAIIMSGYSQELVADGLSPDILFLPKPCTAVSLARPLQQCLHGSRPQG